MLYWKTNRLYEWRFYRGLNVGGYYEQEECKGAVKRTGEYSRG